MTLISGRPGSVMRVLVTSAALASSAAAGALIGRRAFPAKTQTPIGEAMALPVQDAVLVAVVDGDGDVIVRTRANRAETANTLRAIASCVVEGETQ